MARTAGAIYAASANNRVGVGRLGGHGRSKGQDGRRQKQKRTHIQAPCIFDPTQAALPGEGYRPRD